MTITYKSNPSFIDRVLASFYAKQGHVDPAKLKPKDDDDLSRARKVMLRRMSLINKEENKGIVEIIEQIEKKNMMQKSYGYICVEDLDFEELMPNQTLSKCKF